MNNMIILNKSNNIIKSTLFIFIGILLILVVGLRPLKYFGDTDNYLIIIHSFDSVWQVEPTFWLISQFNKLLLGGNEQVFFLIYAILGISIKLVAIRKLSLLPLLSVYIYICLYLVLHEMTQIRVGVASGIFLLAIPDLVNRNFKSYLLKTVLAMLFHYSAVIMLILYFVGLEKINKKIYYSLPILGLILSFVPNLMMAIFTFLEFILPSIISEKINIYLLLIDNANFNKINIFNTFTLSLVAFYYFALFNLNIIKSELNILFIKLFGVQIFVYYAFSCIPAFAFRLSEFLGICMIIFIPHLIFIFKQKLLPTLFILIWASGYLYFISITRLMNF